jgi:putative oxidoreductase
VSTPPLLSPHDRLPSPHNLCKGLRFARRNRALGAREWPNLAQSFDLTNEFNILRIICGLFLIPHFILKAKDIPGTIEVYKAWRLHPPLAWIYSGMVVEAIGAVGLVFAIQTRFVAALVAVFLLVAAWACWRVSGGKWIWNFTGVEYPLFWAICCIVVAMHG